MQKKIAYFLYTNFKIVCALWWSFCI